jgi:hypothetical protein
VLVEKVSASIPACDRWMRLKVLVVDEVSMLDSELFGALEEIARSVRRSTQPFGGKWKYAQGLILRYSISYPADLPMCVCVCVCVLCGLSCSV